jgi:periplasmic divalent cation tolerance protein
MDRAVFVYTTYPSVVEAETAGKTLVEGRLAACVNILPGHEGMSDILCKRLP